MPHRRSSIPDRNLSSNNNLSMNTTKKKEEVKMKSSSKKRKATEVLENDQTKKPTNGKRSTTVNKHDGDDLIMSKDPMHPANHICKLCRQFYRHGWVTGTGGGVSIKRDENVFIAPSGVQKELMKPTDIFVMDFQTKQYLRKPQVETNPPTFFL